MAALFNDPAMPFFTNYFVTRFGGKRATLRHLENLVALHSGKFRRYRQIDAAAVERLVFVCKGNICRSAYGNAVASSLGLLAASFGLDTPGDEPADAIAIRNARLRNVVLDQHRTRSVRNFALQPTDLLVAMEPQQALALEALDGGHQVTLLGLWSAPRRPFIQDPYGRTDAYFQTCFALIESGVHGLRDFLKASSVRPNR